MLQQLGKDEGVGDVRIELQLILGNAVAILDALCREGQGTSRQREFL